MITNKEQYDKLVNLEYSFSKIEDQLFNRIPFAFVNLLGESPKAIKTIVEEHSKYIQSRLNYSDQELMALISEFNSQINEIHKEFKPLGNLQINYMKNAESNLVFGILIAQTVRSIIIKKELAQYQLEKILSTSEKDMYDTDENYLEGIPVIFFELQHLLLKDDFGNFDPEKTITQENKTREIRVFLSSINEIDIFAKTLLTDLSNRSINIPFAILQKKLSTEICYSVSQEIITNFVRNIYTLINQSVKLSDAIETLKKQYKKIALEYLNTGNCTKDGFKIGEIIFNTTSVILEDSNKFDDKFIKELSQEILRLTLNLIIDWVGMPSNFYYIKFREAELNEKNSLEITHALEVFLIDMDNTLLQSVNETYLVSYPAAIKELIFYTATKGVLNSESVKKAISYVDEPRSWLRFKNKLLDKFYPRYYIEDIFGKDN